MSIFKLIKSKLFPIPLGENEEFVQLNKKHLSKLHITQIDYNTEFYFKKSFLKEGDFFEANSPIIQLSPLLENSFITLPFSGILSKILVDKKNSYKLGSKILIVEKVQNQDVIDEMLLKQEKGKLELTEISTTVDDFTDGKTIQFSKVAGEKTEYFKLYRDKVEMPYSYLGITFINHNDYPYIEFCTKEGDVTLAKGDSIILLFDDKTKIHFEFQNSSSGDNTYRRNTYPLNSDLLNTFLNKSILKAKVTSLRKGIYESYNIDHKIGFNSFVETDKPQYSTIKNGQYLLKYMISNFIKANSK